MQRPSGSSLLALFSVALGVASTLTSCQKVFGDYRIDTSQVNTEEVRCDWGESRCRGAVLETCARAGDAWEEIETCESEDLCNLDTLSCTPCKPGEHQCNDKELRRCQPGGGWETVRTCETASLCFLNPDRRGGSCNEPACETPGIRKCDGARLLRCSAGGERWELVQECAAPALCRPDPATPEEEPAGCVPPVCSAGQHRCEGAVLSECAPTLDGWQVKTECASPELCNPKAGACGTAASGELACSGAELYASDSGGWKLLETCARVDLCSPSARTCLPAECDPGSYRCDPLNSELQRCKTDSSGWERMEVCGSVNLCNSAGRRCEPIACDRDAVRCMGPRLERCASDLSGWELQRTCTEGELCDPILDQCVPGECSAGDIRCNERYLEACENGRWQRRERCETSALCNVEAARCDPPVCGGELPSFECLSPTRVKLCLPGRNDFKEDTCTGGTECDPTSGLCK